MTCPDIGYSMRRKKFDSGKIRVLILNVYAACLEPDTSPYFRFSQEYGFVSTNIGTMTQLISHSVRTIYFQFEHLEQGKKRLLGLSRHKNALHLPRIMRLISGGTNDEKNFTQQAFILVQYRFFV